MSFFRFWRSREERGALLRRIGDLRLNPAQLRRLLGDSEVRAELQDDIMISLLPPVGSEVFRCFTSGSRVELKQQPTVEKEEEEQKKRKNKEAIEKNLPMPAPQLQAGKPLPFFYGDPPPELCSTPLEELDPFYQSQKTFLVLGKDNTIFRFNADSSCFLLSPFNPLRTAAIRTLVHPWFRLFVLINVIINCVFMVLGTTHLVHTMGYVFITVYSCEVVVKLVSRGLCWGPFTFLRDPWNWLDVLILITAFLSEFVDLGKLSVLVTIPRILKLFALIPGMRTTLEALIQSGKRLVDVGALMAFVLCTLAVFGLHLFMGSLKHKCVALLTSNVTTGYRGNETESSDFDFASYINNPVNYYFLPRHPEALLCGNSSDSGLCPEGFVCLKAGENPNFGFTSFDSFGWSLLNILRLITHDSWDDLLRLTVRAVGRACVSAFVLVFLPGCFFVVSLAVAVVAVARVEQKEAAAAEVQRREEQFRRVEAELKRREEAEQASSRVVPQEDQDPPQKKNEQEAVATVSGGEDEDRQPPRCACIHAFLQGECCECWRRLRRRLTAFVTNPFFDLGIIICIILNTVIMAMEHYPMTMKFEEILIVADLVFLVIFTAEMVLKLVALGVRGYFQVSWHIFDFIVVVTNVLELGLADISNLSLRSVQLLRSLRLARWWPELHLLMQIIWSSVGWLSLLLVIMVFMFTVVGVQLFQVDYKDGFCWTPTNCNPLRWHMKDYFHSFLLVFRILCGEWIQTTWDCMVGSGHGWCLIFSLLVLVIGRLLVLNLFLNLLLDSGTNDKMVSPVGKGRNLILRRMWTLLGKKNHEDLEPGAIYSKTEDRKEYFSLNLVTSESNNHGNQTREAAAAATTKVEVSKLEHEEVKKYQEPDEGNTPEDCCCHICYHCCQDIDKSQGTGRVWSNFRRACLRIVQHKLFEALIIFIIVLSSAALLLERRPALQSALDTADLVFTAIFLVEMLLKWSALGFRKYFSSFWCWIDFLVLNMSLVSLVLGLLGSSGRTLRSLRTLRILSRSQGMKVVLSFLAASLPSMMAVLLVSMFVWMIFSLLGVHLFAGKFYYCYNVTENVAFQPFEVANKTQCILLNENSTEVRWTNARFNFDNVHSGFVTLVLLAFSSGWKEIMYAAVDSTWVEDQPLFESHLSRYLFFICFMIIGCFFTCNLFIRLFMDNLQQHRHKFGGKHVFMSEGQQKHSRALRIRFSGKPQNPGPRPQNACRAGLFDLLTSVVFEIFKMAAVCVNVVLLMVERDDQSSEMEFILHWFHFAFILFFLTEFILKVIAFGRHYFHSGLNVLDFLVLIYTIIGAFISDLLEKYFISPTVVLLLRLAVMGRLIRLIDCCRGIRTLFLGFVMSLPALFNIGFLFLVTVFTFSVVGMFIFADVNREAGIDDMFNFETISRSMVSMITVTTFSGWDGLLSPIITSSTCNSEWSDTGTCGSPVVGVIFFTSYIVLYFLLVVLLFLTILLETFNAMDPEDGELLSERQLHMFYKTWRRFDPKALQVIPYSQLSGFCDTLQDPLRVPRPNSIRLVHMDLPLLPGDLVHCQDVLHALIAQVFGESGQTDALRARLEEKFKVDNRSPKVWNEPISSTLQRRQEEAAAMVIQRAYRKHRQDGGKAMGVSGSSHQ